MTSCPDINSLIDGLGEGRLQPELQAHLESCPACRADHRILREIPAVLRPEIEVPETLVHRTMAAIAASGRSPRRARAPSLHSLVTAVLGFLTSVSVIVATGSGSPGEVETLLLFSLAVGVCCGALQILAGGEPSGRR